MTRVYLKNGTGLFQLVLVFILFTLAGPASVYAEIYKWVDKDGNVQFGDKPEKGVEAEEVEIKEASPAAADPEARKRMEYQEKLLKVMEEERKQQNEEKRVAREKEEKEKTLRKRNCAEARDYKRTLDASGPIYKLDEEGNRVYLSEEENRAERQRAVELVRKWCD